MKRIVVAACVAGIAGALALAWFFRESDAMPDSQLGSAASAALSQPGTTEDALRVPSAGHKEYQSERYRFSLFYPETLAVKEFEEGGGARTLVFENPAEGKGFQIFIVPYSAEQVTPERFRKDQPSGIRENPADITIDGAPATSFFSRHPVLGHTAEIWFIHRGHLYEVTTVKLDALWLSDIMSTWKFI